MSRFVLSNLHGTCAAPALLLLAALGLAVLWAAGQPVQAAYELLYITSGITRFGCL